MPIRVIGFDEARGRFIEDTHTIVVSKTGSLIAMKHKVFPADVIRIINLENMEEADFRVVGPSIVTEQEVYEWGVECAEEGRNIWGINFPEPLPEGTAPPCWFAAPATRKCSGRPRCWRSKCSSARA